jgi:cobalamin transport system substrate-binding protein
MLKLRRVRRHMASRFCSIMPKKLSHVMNICGESIRLISVRKIVLCLCLLVVVPGAAPLWAQREKITPDFPLEMNELLAALTDAHRPESDENRYPRMLEYRRQRWNMLDDSLTSEQITLSIDQQPQRMIPHSVGLTEVLWAITPQERIVAVHESCRNSAYSFLAGRLPDTLPTYRSEDAEMVIGLRPDLVLTSYYSSATFKNRLTRSHIPFVEMGYFGDIPSIKNQIRFLGALIGAETSAHRLLTTIDQNVAAIQTVVKERLAGRTPKVLYYDRMGFVAGEHSTFDSLCRTLGIENVAAQNGIRFFKQVDYETVLKWDPDIIIVPQDSGLDQRLLGQPILASAKAVRTHKIRTIPDQYLVASSQFAVAGLNYLGGILDEE